jgi:hypothetical protein
VVRSWGNTPDPPESLLDGVDEDDPEAMQGWMKRIKQELGDDAPELNELDLLDAGISPGDTGAGDEDTEAL